MAYAVVCAVALLAAALTLFSGFGLGTLLLPAFAVFFRADLAVAMTAVVHLSQNLFKLALFRRHIDRTVALRFGIPALLAALAGAALLDFLAGRRGALWAWALGGHVFYITVLKLVLGALVAAFAVVELSPRLRDLKGLRIEARHLPLGGALSGFLGGLSGHQGALRAPFLLRAGLGKDAFIATGVVIACAVDVARLAVYAPHFAAERAALWPNVPLVAAAVACAFAGVFAGSRLVKKVTLHHVQLVTAVLLLVLGAALAAGLV